MYLCEKYSDELGNLTILNELKSLAQKGYVCGTLKSKTNIPGMMDVLGGLHITILPDCRNYVEMEKDYDNMHKGGNIVFEKLFGKRREIVKAIYTMTNEDAKHYLRKLAKEREIAEGYSGTLSEEQRDNYFVVTFFRDEINALEKEGFIEITTNTFNGIISLSITQKCRDYFEMEKEYERTMEAKSNVLNVDARGNSGNLTVAGRDAIGITQITANQTDIEQALNMLNKMKNLLEVSGLDDNIKTSIEDDLDIIKLDIESQTPKQSKVNSAMRRIEAALLPLRNIAAVSTLLVHYQQLAPMIAALFGGA